MRKLWIRYVACFILLAVLLLVLLVWNICAGSVDFTAEELLAALANPLDAVPCRCCCRRRKRR